MSRMAVALTLALALATPAAAGPPIELPALTRIAAKLSGLHAHGRVQVQRVSAAGMKAQVLRVLDRDYPADQQSYDETLYRALGLLRVNEKLRPILAAQETQGVLGLYDPLGRRLYVRTGPSVRAALLHELVHALQDQAFDLRRLSALRRGSRDAALAASAAVEGDAVFATQLYGGRVVALRRPQAVRAPASHGGSRIRLFLSLEYAFPYTTGFRFAADLHNLGGNAAIFGALRRFPETTEQIFHVDAFLAREPALAAELPPAAGGFSLQRRDTFGELDVRALLAIFQVPRLDHVGEGWGGGTSGLYRDGAGASAVALRLDWDAPLDAAQWDEAVTTYVNEAFDADVPGFPATTPCEAEACWSIAGRSIAFARTDTRTALVFGPSIPAAASLASGIVAAPQ